MKKTNQLTRTLWVTVAFAEIGALSAFFLSGKVAVVNEVTGGQPVLFGMELLVLAGLATYTALRKDVSKSLIWLIIVLNGLLLFFLSTRLADGSVSDLGKELIAVDMLVVLTLIIGQIRSIRTDSQRNQATPA